LLSEYSEEQGFKVEVKGVIFYFVSARDVMSKETESDARKRIPNNIIKILNIAIDLATKF